MPASGDQTRTVILVLLAVNGIVGTEKFGPVDTVVPAHSSAVADLMTLATLLAAFVDRPPRSSRRLRRSRSGSR